MFKLELGNSDSRFYLPLSPFNCIGPVDQPGRSPALQAGGLGFKSRRVHHYFYEYFLWQTPLDINAHDSSNYAGDYG